MTNRANYWLFSLALAIASLLISLAMKDSIHRISRYTLGQENYAILFSSMLFVSLIFLRNRLIKSSPNKAALLGGLIGYFCGAASCLIEYMLTAYGLERTANAISSFGILSAPFLMFVFIPPILTGGWLVGAMLFYIIRKCNKA